MVHFTWIIFCLLLSGVILNIFTKKNKEINDEKRELNIDGLRYILAGLVAFHHNEFSYNFFLTSHWNNNLPYEFFIGKFAVAIFFIISGYLFSDINYQGEHWVGFYIKRFFRIAPMCYISSTLCIIISIYIGAKNGNNADFKDILYWFDAGITNIHPAVYGVKYSHLINAGVTWTLVWEWLFYFSLPLFVIVSGNKNKLAIILTIITFCFYIYSKFDYGAAVFVALFAVGGLCKQIKNILARKNFTINKKYLEVISIIIVAYLFFKLDNPLSLSSTVVYFFLFLCFSLGADWFGLLTSRGFVKLGDASYSIYILHGIGWFIMNKICFHFELTRYLYIYYGIQTLTWLLICIICIITYTYVEKNFNKLGAQLANKFTK
jgi:peptidoglycan/LPS O-acetylase OafA/YrhL